MSELDFIQKLCVDLGHTISITFFAQQWIIEVEDNEFSAPLLVDALAIAYAHYY